MCPRGPSRGLTESNPLRWARLQSAVLTSRKPIAALAGHQVRRRDTILQLESFKEETVIFEGTAEEAARAFPTTSNVAASSAAGGR